MDKPIHTPEITDEYTHTPDGDVHVRRRVTSKVPGGAWLEVHGSPDEVRCLLQAAINKCDSLDGES